MRILIIAPASSVHTVRWVNALADKGNKIFLVSLPNHRMAANKIAETVKVFYLKFNGTKGYYLNALYLRQIHKEFHADIIHVHYASGYGTLARIARLPNILLSAWGSDVYDFPYESKVKMCIICRNLLYAKKIASTSHAMAAQIQQLIGEKKISVTPFGVDTNIFKKKNEVIDKEHFTVGIIKTLSPIYGIDIVIRAFSLFLKHPGREEARLVIYGDGKEKTKLIQLCKKLGILLNVEFAGYIANIDVPKALSKIDVVCLGSRKESFGVSAVEAMACEVPVIATVTDGFLEVIDDGTTGFLVPVNDYKAMAEKLSWLYQDYSLREKMGKAGRRRVLELFDWEKNVELMINIYKILNK